MLSDGGGIISESGGDYFSELGGEIISESGGRIASEFALSDNGSARTAPDTRLFAQAPDLTPCFTPVASPRLNDMSKA